MGDTLDRVALEQLLARQIPDSNAGQLVDLASVDAKVFVRRIDGEVDSKIATYAAAPYAGMAKPEPGTEEMDDLNADAGARALIAGIRWCVVDEDTGQPLCSSYAQARQLVKALSVADIGAIQTAMRAGLEHQVRTVEEGKAP
jgi:hypothetical protein